MRVQGFIVVLALAAGVIFALLNQGAVMEVKTVRIPGFTYTGPVLGAVLTTAGAVILVMLVVSMLQGGLQRRALARTQARLAQREREISEMKGRAYDDVSEKIDALREELIARLPSAVDVRDDERAAVGPSS